MNEVRTLREAEAEAIRRALRETKGNMTKTAEVLDVDRKTLYRKMERYEINRAEFMPATTPPESEERA